MISPKAGPTESGYPRSRRDDPLSVPAALEFIGGLLVLASWAVIVIAGFDVLEHFLGKT